jgi:hypothetical protein
MSGAMRFLDITPDKISNKQLMNAETLSPKMISADDGRA